MQAYMFITKEAHNSQRVQSGYVGSWSCSKTTRPGDSAFVYVAGTGVRCEWCATSDARKDKKWAWVCDVEFVRSFEPPITIKELRAAVPQTDWSPPHQNFRGFRSISIPRSVAVRIRGLRGRAGPSLLDVQRQFDQKVKQSLALPATQRRKRLSSASRKPKQVEVVAKMFLRNEDVAAEVLTRAKGKCELCHAPAPFRRATDGSAYLEVHHLVRLADGGDDTTANAVATCPNCHRRAHFGENFPKQSVSRGAAANRKGCRI